ncbi:MAG: ADP-ribosylglycohydrolase family protein [Desulfurobacteriaceae bacterium]
MLYEKIKGCIFGAAIGDALGTLVEEMDKDTVKKAYGGPILDFVNPSPISVCPHLKKGQYSHETQMFLLALEVYAEKGTFDEFTFIEKLTEWVKDEKSHRYPAGSHINAALSYLKGADPTEARVKAIDIDGAIPAVAAGIFRWDSSYDAYEDGVKIASITHNDETLLDTAGVLAVAISEVIGGRVSFSTKEDRLGFIDVLREFSQTEMVRAYLDMVSQALLKEITSIDDLTLILGNGSFAPESFGIALFLAMENSRNFRNAILKAVNSYGEFGGDTDAIGFITGGLVGGYLGFSAIPGEWVERLEHKDYFDIISQRLCPDENSI